MTAPDPKIPPTLDDAIEATYAAFARYGQPRESSYSTHTNITSEDITRLRAAPLRALQPENLSKFSLKALNTWGDEDEFRHYLPRMLELTVRAPNWTPLASLLLKLDTGRWREWPANEQAALTRFVTELWTWVITDQHARVSPVDLLLGASYAGMPLAVLIDRWKKTDGPVATRRLAALIIQEGDAIAASGLLGRRWSSEAREQLGRFVTSDAARERLEAAFFGTTDAEVGEEISRAISVLERAPPPQSPPP